jgi:hypothetical protein
VLAQHLRELCVAEAVGHGGGTFDVAKHVVTVPWARVRLGRLFSQASRATVSIGVPSRSGPPLRFNFSASERSSSAVS